MLFQIFIIVKSYQIIKNRQALMHPIFTQNIIRMVILFQIANSTLKRDRLTIK